MPSIDKIEPPENPEDTNKSEPVQNTETTENSGSIEDPEAINKSVPIQNPETTDKPGSIEHTGATDKSKQVEDPDTVDKSEIPIIRRMIKPTIDEVKASRLDLTASSISQIVSGVFSLVITYLFPKISPANALLLGFILLFVILQIRGNVFQLIKRKRITLLITFIIFASFTLMGSVYISNAQQRKIVYFIVDASEQSRGILKESIALLRVKFKTTDPKVYTALTVIGGGLSGTRGCQDIYPIVDIIKGEEGIPKILEYLEDIVDLQNVGHAGIQESIEVAIRDVKEFRKNQRVWLEVVLITSGVDDECNKLNKAKLEAYAESVGVNLSINILPIGEISSVDLQRLSEFTGSDISAVATAGDLQKEIEKLLTNPFDRPWYYYIIDYQ